MSQVDKGSNADAERETVTRTNSIPESTCTFPRLRLKSNYPEEHCILVIEQLKNILKRADHKNVKLEHLSANIF